MLDLGPESLFIADLHLRKDRPEVTRRFIRFLDLRAKGAEALYMLGDIFDLWVGDDDPTPPNREVIRQLRKLTDSGTKVFFQAGNRDFLVKDRFAAETGVQLLEDHTVIDLYGTATLLMHGDLLCTDDTAYQAFREKTHDPQWQRRILSKPLLFRLLIAFWYQFRANRDKSKKSLEIMDVNQAYVKQTLEKYRVKRLIHGHTHRPKIHKIELNGETAYRFVLSQWENHGSVLCWSPEGYRVERI